MTKTAGIVEASGRSYTWFIPPNKVTIHPDTMPTWDGSCAQQNSARLRAALTASNDPERIELWDPMIAASADHMLYPKNDTHWKSAGALIAAERIAERAAPGVWDMAEIDANVEPDRGDLAAFMGIEWPSSDTIFRTALTGVTPTITNEGVTIEDRPVVGYSTAAGHGASTLETVTLHDSTTYALRNQIGPLFEHIVFVPSAEDEIPDDALPYLVDSEQIIVGIVERNVLGHWNRSGFAGSMAAALADDFPHTAATWNPVADGVTFDLPAPAGDSLRYLVLGLDSDTTVTIDTRTSAQLAPDEGAWPDRVVPGTTRYGFELMDGAATLTLPIPSSVTITEAFVITID
jgi:hypothetical protein